MSVDGFLVVKNEMYFVVYWEILFIINLDFVVSEICLLCIFVRGIFVVC